MLLYFTEDLLSLSFFRKNCHIVQWLHSAVMCLRGARSHQGCPLSLGALDLALAEGWVAPAH